MKWWINGIIVFVIFIIMIAVGTYSSGLTTLLAVFLLIQYIELRLDKLSTQQ